MKQKALLFFYILLVLLMAHTPAAGQNAGLSVIGNAKGVPPELKESELRSILMGERKRWKNGYKISIALMKTSTIVGNSTRERIYHMSDDELNSRWLEQSFGGKGNVPKLFNTVDELLAFVAGTPGAIGVVTETPATPGTQVVLIDGRRSL